MPEDPFVKREKFTRAHSFAAGARSSIFEKYPKERYQTRGRSWRKLQSDNIEFTMKRLREPIEAEGEEIGQPCCIFRLNDFRSPSSRRGDPGCLVRNRRIGRRSHLHRQRLHNF